MNKPELEANNPKAETGVGSTRLLGQQEITLTIQQIKELAEFAGLTISTKVSSLDDMEAEITVLECEAGHEVIEDDGSRVRHKHVTYYTDYPEEGVMPLGRPNVKRSDASDAFAAAPGSAVRPESVRKEN